MRVASLLWLSVTLALTGCLGPRALHQAVLGYDESVSRLERELLLLNIARTHLKLPGHFTVTSSVTATFDFRANVGAFGTFFVSAKPLYGVNALASIAESPTLTILPVQGEEFNTRILTPLDERRFQSLLLQGVPIDMVIRLMADGLEFYKPDGGIDGSVMNWPGRPDEYQEFRRRALHLASLQASQELFVGPLILDDPLRATLPAQLSPGEQLGALERGWRPVDSQTYELSRQTLGRVAITNYDPRMVSNAERLALNARAGASNRTIVLVDIRPGHPGGQLPMAGAIRLRSFNRILVFLAAGIGEVAEFDVAPDPRSGPSGPNPRRTLGIDVTDSKTSSATPSIAYGGKYYSVAPTAWDREAFRLLHELFQMTVTESARAVAPAITIGK